MNRYKVYITPQALKEVKSLPSRLRQRVKRAINQLAAKPRLPGSRALEAPTDISAEVRRLRLDQWRLIYTINENDNVIDVLAVRKRPPYDYDDLIKLLAEPD